MSTKKQLVKVIKKLPLNSQFNHEEIELLEKNLFRDNGFFGESFTTNEWADKNGWSLTLSKLFNPEGEIICDNFTGKHNLRYLSYLCKNCQGIFNAPFQVEKCMFCGHQEMEKQKSRINIRESFHGVPSENQQKELYDMAVKDIQEHGDNKPAEPEYDLDWDWLGDHV